MLIINRYWNTPIKGGTGNTQILHALINKVNHLIATGYRLDKIWIFFNIFQEMIGILTDFEEICLLRNLLYRTVTIWTAAIFIQLMLSPIAFTWSTIKAGIGPLVNIPLGINTAEYLLNHLFMTLLCGTNKIIIGNIQQLPEILKACYDRIYIFNWRNALLLSLLLNLLTMLITACQKENILICQTMKSSYRICNGGAVSVPNVKLGTRVINWGSNIKTFFIQR